MDTLPVPVALDDWVGLCVEACDGVCEALGVCVCDAVGDGLDVLVCDNVSLGLGLSDIVALGIWLGLGDSVAVLLVGEFDARTRTTATGVFTFVVVLSPSDPRAL